MSSKKGWYPATPERASGGGRHSRLHRSDDIPYSEAQFRTPKRRPEFPARFGSFGNALVFCRRFFAWYNGEHRHSGTGWHVPVDVHYQRAAALHQRRRTVPSTAYTAHPEQFVRNPPQPPEPVSQRVTSSGRIRLSARQERLAIND